MIGYYYTDPKDFEECKYGTRIGWLAYRNGLNIGMRHLHAS